GVQAQRMRELGQEDALRAGYTFVRTHDRESQYVELLPRVRIAHPGHDLRQRARALDLAFHDGFRAHGTGLGEDRGAFLVGEASIRASGGDGEPDEAQHVRRHAGHGERRWRCARGRRRRLVLSRRRLVNAPGQPGRRQQRAGVDEGAPAAGEEPGRPAAPLPSTSDGAPQHRADQVLRCHASLREAARIASRPDSTLCAPNERPSALDSCSRLGRSGPRSRRTFRSASALESSERTAATTARLRGTYTLRRRRWIASTRAAAQSAVEVTTPKGPGRRRTISSKAPRSCRASRTRSVSIQQGCATPTPTPLPASSRRSELPSCSTPLLDAAYAARPGPGARAAAEEIRR